MRKGSKFSGSEQDLDNAIRENLPKFIMNDGWLDSVENQVSEQEFTNICESLAEAIERGYILDKVGIHYLLNGKISFYYLDTSNSDRPQPYKLSESGKSFLDL